jgi:hypothetical protein
MEEESREEEGVRMEVPEETGRTRSLQKAELYQPRGGDKFRQGGHRYASDTHSSWQSSF